MHNEISTIPCSRIDADTVEMDVTLEPLESILLVFQDKHRPLPARQSNNQQAPGQPIPLVREAIPAPADGNTSPWDACSWVWYPEGKPAQTAPAGNRCFRGTVTLPADRKIKTAHFLLAADNEFSLWVNGQIAGTHTGNADAWKRPETLDVASKLKAGVNHFAILAGNLPGPADANPTGLIGHYVIEFETGEPVVGRIDSSWKAMNREPAGWSAPEFDDRDWPSAMLVARHGEAPWGRLDQPTDGRNVSPVKADPFLGHCQIPANLDLTKARVFLELDDLAPEVAASVTVNGKFAGGFIGRPLPLEVTRHLQPGANTLRIEPFAPSSARLVAYSR